MKFLALLVFVGFFFSAQALTLNVSPYNDWVDNQQGTPLLGVGSTQPVGYLYWQQYAGTTYTNLVWSAPQWCYTGGCVNIALKKQSYQNLRSQPFDATTSTAIVFHSYVDSTDLRINVTVRTTTLPGDMIFYVRRLWANRTTRQTILTHPIPNNGSVDTDFTFSNSSVSVSVGEYIVFQFDGNGNAANDIGELRNYTITGTGTNGFLTLNAFDELQPTSSKQFNLTIANSSNSTAYFVNYSNAPSFNKTLSEIPTGEITLTVRNHTCQTGNVIPRQYVLNTSSSNLNFSAFLLCDGATVVTTTFLTKDAYTGVPLDGVLVSAQRTIGGATVNVTTQQSSAGALSMYLDGSTTYQLLAVKAGYTPLYQAFQPTSNGAIYSLLLVNSTTPSFNTILEGINFTTEPQYITNASNNVLWYSINASNNTLVSYGIDILAYNGTLVGQGFAGSQVNASSTSGSNLSLVVNASTFSNVTFVAWFIKAGFARYNFTRTFFVLNTTSGSTSLTGAIDNYRSNAPSNTFTGIMSVVITAPIAAWVARYASPTAAGVATLLILGMFTFLANWFPVTAWLLLVFFTVSVVYFIRGRG